MGNKKTKQSTTSSSSTSLNDWSKNLFEGGMSNIMGTIDKFNTNSPFKPYTGSMVADLSGGERQARQYASTNLGSTAGMFGDAENAIKTGMATEWNPEQVAAPREVSYRTFDADRVRQRTNPYERDVVDATGAYIDEQRDREMSMNQARATQSGAFGGSRHGVADAELMRTASMDKAGMLADLKYRGWNDAVAGDERETAGIFGADTFNSTGDFNARAFNAGRNDEASRYRGEQQFRGAGMLSDLAGQKQDSWMRETQMMNQLGMDERKIADAKLLAERAQYDERAADEWRRFQLELQTRIGLLGATPLLTNTQGTGTNTTSQSGINFAQIGGLLSGVGALGDLWRKDGDR
jgi:hypothetical protein